MDAEIIQIIELIVAAAMAVFAYIRNRQKNQAETGKALAQEETAQVIRFFDPTDDTVTQAPPSLPTRTYKMTNETKRWIIFDHPPVEQEAILRQIAEAEAQGSDIYTIDYPGGYYEIEYGLLKGGGGCAKKSGAA